MNAGKKIKSIRMQRGETMKEFASRIDGKASKGTISKWENGKYLPNNERLKKIAELANISVNELLYDRTVGYEARRVANAYEVGCRIGKIRDKLNMTQEEFGIFVDNANKSNVSKWERGEVLPKNKRLKLIAVLGEISVGELLYDQTDVVTVKKVKNGVPTVIEVDGRTYIYQSPDQYRKPID